MKAMHEAYLSTEQDTQRLRRAFMLAAAFVALLWLVKLIEIVFDLDLSRYGLYPRRLPQLTGILTAPLIHGSLSHLFANSLPLIVLGTALLYGYPRSARIVFPAIYVGAGLGVWLFAREAWHIGASGLSFGMMFFVFTVGALRWDTRAIVLSLIVFFLYGSMIWGVLPGDPRVSFESHLSGAVCGVLLAVLLRHRDPPPPEKHYSWEGETVADEDATDTDESWRRNVAAKIL